MKSSSRISQKDTNDKKQAQELRSITSLEVKQTSIVYFRMIISHCRWILFKIYVNGVMYTEKLYIGIILKQLSIYYLSVMWAGGYTRKYDTCANSWTCVFVHLYAYGVISLTDNKNYLLKSSCAEFDTHSVYLNGCLWLSEHECVCVCVCIRNFPVYTFPYRCTQTQAQRAPESLFSFPLVKWKRSWLDANTHSHTGCA